MVEEVPPALAWLFPALKLLQRLTYAAGNMRNLLKDPLFTFEQTDNGAISGPLTSRLLGRLPYIASDSTLQSGWRKRTLVTAEEAASSSVSSL